MAASSSKKASVPEAKEAMSVSRKRLLQSLESL